MRTFTITLAGLLFGALPAFSSITVQAYFEMGDNGAGIDNRPADSSTNSRDFEEIEGDVVTLNPSGGGYNNDANYSFDGSQGYFDIGYVAPSNNVGIELWVRTSNLTQENRTIFGTGSTLTGMSIGYEGGQGGSVGWFGAVAGAAYAGNLLPASYTAGEWIHLAVVRDDGITAFYVNGVATSMSFGPASTPPNPIDAATNAHIGWTPGGGGFEGDIAQARIFTFEPGGFSTTDLLYPGFSTPPTGFFKVGANANFKTTALSTDDYSVFRLGGAVSDFANVHEPDGLSVVLENEPTHEIDIEVEGPLAPGNYPLIGYSGTIGGLGFAGLELFQITSSGGGRPYQGELADTGSTIDLVITGGGPVDLTWTGEESAIWDFNDAGNWKTTVGGTASTFFTNDSVRFDDSAQGTSPLTVSLTGTIEPASVVIDNETKDFTLEGSGISGGGSLVKSGAAALVLENPNSYSGPTSIQDGRVVVAPGGSLGSGTITNDAELEFANTDPLIVATAINGVGLIEKTGIGSLQFSASNTGFTGDVSHQAGTIRAGNVNGLGVGPGTITVADGATLDVNGIGFGGKPVLIEGAGVGGQGAIINSGALQFNGVSALTLIGDATIGGTGRWDVRGATTTVQGDHTLTKVGTNEIGLVEGTYSVRDIVVTQGRLSIEFGAVVDNNNPGTITVTGGRLGVGDFDLPVSVTKPIVLDGGTLGTTAGSSLGNATIAAPVSLNATLNPFAIQPGATLRLEGIVSGSGGLLMPVTNGGGTLVLAEAPEYTGDTTVNLGTLVLEAPGLDDNSTVALGASATLRMNFQGTDTVAALTINGVSQPEGTYNASHSSGRFAGTGTLFVGTGAPAGYAAWAAGFPALTDPDPMVDFDGDGLATGIEYVVGGDPTASDAAGIAPTFDTATDPDHFLFTYRLSDLAAADPAVTAGVEYGSDLSGWTIAAHDPGGTGVTITVTPVANEDHALVTVAIPHALAVNGVLFARLFADFQ